MELKELCFGNDLNTIRNYEAYGLNYVDAMVKIRGLRLETSMAESFERIAKADIEKAAALTRIADAMEASNKRQVNSAVLFDEICKRYKHEDLGHVFDLLIKECPQVTCGRIIYLDRLARISSEEQEALGNDILVLLDHILYDYGWRAYFDQMS